jgi:hypothetical protein
MTESPTTRDFAEQSTEGTVQWTHVFAEQSLNLSKAACEGYLTTTRRTAEGINQQASEIRERLISLAADALSNSFDFANRVVRVKDPHEVLQLQSEFLSRQTQTLAEQTHELGQVMMRGANAASRATVGQMQRAAE